MTNNFNNDEGKSLIKSKTFWGTVITAIAVFLPQRAKEILGSTDEVLAIGGLLFTLIGRVMAKSPVTGLITSGKRKN